MFSLEAEDVQRGEEEVGRLLGPAAAPEEAPEGALSASERRITLALLTATLVLSYLDRREPLDEGAVCSLLPPELSPSTGKC